MVEIKKMVKIKRVEKSAILIVKQCRRCTIQCIKMKYNAIFVILTH